MGKIVKAAIVIGIAVAIAVAAPALAPGLLAAFSVTATATATAIATAVITTALTVAASMAMQALASRPSSKTTPSIFRQSIANSFLVYGKRRVGGLIIFVHGAKVGKQTRYFVIAVAGHPTVGATKWFLNDEEVTVDGSGAITSGDYAGNGWLWYANGAAGQEANSTFVSETGGKWSAEHRGQGLSLIYAKFRMTKDVVEAGMPNITAEVEGKNDIYDPRDGTTGYTNNAALVFYDWMRLPREEGGFGAFTDEIPDDDWISAQANVCDEDVPLAAGGTEKRYAFDSVITTGAAPSEVRETFMISCAGTYTYSGGKHLLRVGYWVPVSSTLLEADLAGPITVPALLGGEEIATEVSGTFIDPANKYQPQPVATRSVASTDIRQADYDLAHITSQTRAQRILEIMLRRAQCERRVTWPMNIAGLNISAMDTVQLDTDRYGLSNYAFVVSNWSLSADFSIVLNLREENADIYEWTEADELDPGETPDLDKPTSVADDQLVTGIAAIGDAGEADISWNFPSGTFEYVKVYRSTSTDFLTAVAISGELAGVSGALTSYTATGLSAGTHYFWVVAFDADDAAYTEVGPVAAVVT